jgi:hypothetical protein
MKKSLLLLLIGLGLALGAAACGEDDDDNNTTPPANNGEADMANNGEVDMPTNNGEPDMPANNGEPDMPANNGEPDMPANNGEPDMPGDPLCEEYCDVLFQGCNGNLAQYDTPSECMEVCATLPRDGMDGDVSGNSIQCRIYHAGVAVDTDPGFHCPHAGPTGGGVCVDEPAPLCDSYCGFMIETCPGTFANVEACQTACDAYPDTGALGDRMGNTAQCRFTYAALAAAPNAGEDLANYCANAAPTGNGVCGLPFGQIDRMGRPAINTALIGSADKDNYNQASSDDGAQFAAQMEASLAFVDGLDGNTNNGFLAGARSALAGVLAADYLIVDISKDDCTNGYLAVEVGLVTETPHTLCGGRTLEEDIIDKTLQVLVDAGGAVTVSDDIDTNNVQFSTDFPYVASPIGN